MNKTLLVNREQCEKILTIEKSISSMKHTLVAISENQTQVLQRQMLLHKNGNKLANMPASLISEGVTGSKIAIFPGVETAKKNTQQGIVSLFSIETGALIGIIDASTITVIRTAGTSAAATDVLARKNSEVVAILGSGKQGKAHARAMIAIRNIKKVYMWDLYLTVSKKACELLKSQFPEVEFIPCETAKEAVLDADIICTTTPATTDEPIVFYEWIKKGAHINAVGACTAKGRELDGKTIGNSKIFVDWRDAVLRDAGDILLAVSKGEVSQIPKFSEVGKVISGKEKGRENDDEITMFESVGISVEDIAAAKVIYDYAKDNEIGIYVAL